MIGLNFNSFIRNDEKSDFWLEKSNFWLKHRFDLYTSKYDKCLPKKKKKKKKTNHNFEHFPAGENGVRALASS